MLAAGLVLGGLALGLLVAEVGVRWSGAAPEVVQIQQGRFRLSANPKIGYEPVPDLEYRGPLDSFHDYSGSSNSLGFRDIEHAVDKEPGVFRILVLGDSVAAGQRVPRFEDTFPARLEADLTGAGLLTEVLSFAVTGYNTRQEVEMLREKGLAYRPDLVLLAYCLNDRGRSDGGVMPTLLERKRGSGAVVRSELDSRLMASAVYRLIRFRRSPAVAEDEAERELGITAGDTRREAFELLERLAAERGFRVLVTVFPHFGGLLDEYRFAAEHEEVRRLAGAAGFAYLDLLEPYRACRRAATQKLAHDRWHPTASGHACAARATAEHILGSPERLTQSGSARP